MLGVRKLKNIEIGAPVGKNDFSGPADPSTTAHYFTGRYVPVTGAC